MESYPKYRYPDPVKIENRQWPDRVITQSPKWASVDLRDGNQALAIPMGVDEKLRLYGELLKVGFREIEVGFPAASDTEYAFLRKLVDGNLVPDGVSLQVLTQSRERLIRKTFDSLKGAKSAIVHLYNSTSALQRKVTFKMSRAEIIEIARSGARLVRSMADDLEAAGTRVRMEYSPESFSDTELDFALEICEAVKEIWKPTPGNKIIINLPETVQYSSPNVYADQIEWMSRNISQRDLVEISLHTHNDRGTGVAATEFGIMAGADRVEGTLFGNGERTGNLDIVTAALNMYAEGVDPGLELSDLPEIRRVYEECTGMKVPPRHPYAGDLVFTAFSGSHQDAIKKGMEIMRSGGGKWEVPYLLIDPRDIGCSYEAIIRINSQSGKGGVCYILGEEFGFDIPKPMMQQVGDFVNGEADKLGRELQPPEIRSIFSKEFVGREAPVKLESYKMAYEEGDTDEPKSVKITAKLLVCGEEKSVSACGNGPINALVNAFDRNGMKNFKVADYRSHAIGKGSATNSAAYVCLESAEDKRLVWGVGVDANIESAGLKGLISAYNRLNP